MTSGSEREIVLDIETQNTFQEVGKYDHRLLRVSLVGIYDSTTDDFQSFFEGELHRLWPMLENANRIIGYNISGFDLPVLNRYYPGDLLRLQTLDLMAALEGSLGYRVRLEDVAQATLGEGKTGSGLLAVELFRRGEYQKLREYCLNDVRVTRDIYRFGLAQGMVRVRGRTGAVQEVPVDFGAVKERQRLNLTMPF